MCIRDRLAVARKDLEPWVAVGPVEEARADAGVATRERHVNCAEGVLRDQLRVPERLAGRSVEPFDVEHDVVLDLTAREHRPRLRPESPADGPVVPPHAVEA